MLAATLLAVCYALVLDLAQKLHELVVYGGRGGDPLALGCREPFRVVEPRIHDECTSCHKQGAVSHQRPPAASHIRQRRSCGSIGRAGSHQKRQVEQELAPVRAACFLEVLEVDKRCAEHRYNGAYEESPPRVQGYPSRLNT